MMTNVKWPQSWSEDGIKILEPAETLENPLSILQLSCSDRGRNLLSHNLD